MPQADLTNWRLPPHSQWAFRNIGEVIPARPVPKGHGPALPLLEGRPLDGFSVTALTGERLDMAAFLEATATDAMIVLHQGHVVFETYGEGNGRHIPHILMSASKSVTGLIAGIAAARGDLDLEAPVTAYIPEAARTPYEDATPRLLLDMRTGVRLDPAQAARYGAAAGWDPTPAGEAPMGLHEFYETLSAPHAPHGGPFAYVSANTDLLGWIVERATGRDLPTLTSELLWRLLGAEDDALLTVDRDGNPRPTGGYCATVRDFARLGHLVAQGGSYIIPADWIADIETGGDHEAWAKGEFAPAFPGPPMRYRNGWYVIDGEPQILFAMGIHGQNLFVDRTNQIVIAKLSSQPQPFDFATDRLTHRAVGAIRKALLGA